MVMFFGALHLAYGILSVTLTEAMKRETRPFLQARSGHPRKGPSRDYDRLLAATRRTFVSLTMRDTAPT